MSKKRKARTVRVRNAAPFAQALYLEREATVVVEAGQEIDVPLSFLERLRKSRWEQVGGFIAAPEPAAIEEDAED